MRGASHSFLQASCQLQFEGVDQLHAPPFLSSDLIRVLELCSQEHTNKT